MLNALESVRTNGLPVDLCGPASHFSFLLRASVRRHRSNYERITRRALNCQVMYLPPAAWRCGRLKGVRRFAAPESETFPAFERFRRLCEPGPGRPLRCAAIYRTMVLRMARPDALCEDSMVLTDDE